MPNNPAQLFTRRTHYEWLLLIFALALIGAFFIYLNLADSERATVAERDRLHVLTNVVAVDIQNNLATVNVSLEGVIHDYPLGKDVPGVRDYLTLRLQAVEKAIPGIRALLVLNAAGVSIAASKSTLLGIDLSYRDYFKTLRDHPDKRTLYVSPPFQSLKKEPDLVITVSRMMPGPGGEFAGMVVAVLDQDYFADSFVPVIYAPDVWGFVVHGDGRQMLNFPEKSGIDGTDLNPPETFFSRHRRSGQVESVVSGRLYTTGEQRMMVLRTIQPASLHMDKAIVVGLSRTLEAIAKPLNRRAAAYALAYAVMLMLSCGGLYYAQSRRARIEALAGQLERERFEANDRMQVALRGANLGLWSLHVPSNARWYDDNGFAMLGLTPQNLDDDPELLRRRLHRDDLPGYLAALGRCIDGSVPLLDATFRLQHGLGHWIWMLARGQAIERDTQGRAIKIMGTYLDVSAAKAAEQEVVRSRDELQAIFDKMTEGVLVFDNSRTLIRANRGARSVLGLFDPATPMEEVWDGIEVCLPGGEPLPKDDWPTRRGFRGDFARNLELEIRRKDSSENVFVEINVTPVYSEAGALDLLIVTYANVTERRVTHSLRESEARFRTLIEDAPLAIAILRSGHFIYTNPRYRRLHGYGDEDDLSGLPWSAMISPTSRIALRDQEQSIAADSPVEHMFEAEGVGKQGGMVPVFKTTARVTLIDGPATLIFAQDISAQKRAEAELRQARDAAEAANRSKAEFLANMSHEIRSPLNAILGLAYLLEQAPLELDAHNMVRKIRASGRTLLGIINDILDVSKIEAGHMVIECVPFRLDEVVDNLAGTMGIVVGDKDVELIIHPPPAGISSLMGDALRLEQVLNNLTSNAIKFTEHGRVEVRISLESRDGRNLVLRFSVLDTGIGIAPELQEEVFSAFTQADSSTTRRFGGTGLGLTICRRLVGLMGGEIGLLSTPGRGSEFWFALPLQQVAEDRFSSPDMANIDALVADGSELELQVVVDVASGLGWQVTGLTSGEAVLAHLLDCKDGKLPNVVVLDWHMPGMDGIATARAIRDCLPAETCPVVVMASAYALPALAAQPDADIVDAILNKPVTASALYNATVEAQRRRAAVVGVIHPSRRISARDLEGVSVLVVDDSEINREVARRILIEQGAIVALAVDGRDALNWLQAHPDEVDLVLMDVQMPVMDGIEATRKLRQMPQFNDLPIVALTAGVFKSQQEAARAAGMTHFISKPFDVPTTIALIQRLRRRPIADGNASDRTAAMPDDEESHASPSNTLVIDIVRGLRIWSDPQSYRDYLRRFAESYGNAVETMRDFLAVNDRAGAEALAHKLAGVAANMALPDTQRMAIEAERILSAGYEHTLALARLENALQHAILAIDRFAPSMAETQDANQAIAVEADLMTLEQQATLRVLLKELLVALDTDNPAPMKPILNTLTTLVSERELADIRKCVRDFDFRGAELCTANLAVARGILMEE